MKDDQLVGNLIHLMDELVKRGLMDESASADIAWDVANAWFSKEEDLTDLYEHFQAEAQAISSEDPDGNVKFLRAITPKPEF